MVPRLMGNATKEMQGIRMIRLRRQDPPITGFGLRQASGLLMLEARLQKIRDNHRRHRVCRLPGVRLVDICPDFTAERAVYDSNEEQPKAVLGRMLSGDEIVEFLKISK